MRADLVRVLLVVCCCFLSQSVRADGFDGVWSVRVVIEQGPCARPPLWRYKLRIQDGRLGPADPQSETATITGEVGPDGDVRAIVRRGDDNAVGQGTLVGQTGSGSWSSKSRGCSGTWTVVRVGD